MNKLKKMFFMLGTLIISFSLFACKSPKNNDNNDDSKNSSLSKFGEEINKANEYSYEIYQTNKNKISNETNNFVYKFAKSGELYGFSIEGNSGLFTFKTTYLLTEKYFYMITVDEESKTAFKSNVNKDLIDLYNPNYDFIFNFNSTYKLKNKTKDVMVGNVKTICYEYDISGMTYKYYVTNDEYIVKVEWEDITDYLSMEIKNFKTSNIDKSILTIPTTEAGYEIIDL